MARIRYGSTTKYGLPVAMYPTHDLRDTIEQLATAECRSLGKQVEALVREALAARAAKAQATGGGNVAP